MKETKERDSREEVDLRWLRSFGIYMCWNCHMWASVETGLNLSFFPLFWCFHGYFVPWITFKTHILCFWALLADFRPFRTISIQKTLISGFFITTANFRCFCTKNGRFFHASLIFFKHSVESALETPKKWFCSIFRPKNRDFLRRLTCGSLPLICANWP